MPRININLTEDAYNKLKKTADQADMDMSELVRQSLRVMSTLQEEKQKGQSIYIGHNGKADKELLVP